ncbi:MAG TPA: LEA type 2 family protein [Gemmatimonadales bacterium]|nr:LEA type 2 family protein [Gemmatimonadales bacterium]
MRTPLLAIAAAAVTLSGCAAVNTWTHLQAPQVEVAGIRVSSLGLSSGTFDVTLRVNNPNGVDLHGTRLVATVDTKDQRFADIDLSNAFTLPKGAAVPIVVPVTIQWSGAGSAVRQLIGSGAVPYRIGGRVTVDTPIGAKGLDFSSSGTVSVVR